MHVGPSCRCQELSNGAMIPAVADFAQMRDRLSASSSSSSAACSGGLGFEGKQLLTPDQLRKSLK